jgi:hypothetical protein
MTDTMGSSGVMDLSFDYLHPGMTTPQQEQNLLRPTWKGTGCGPCEAKARGNIAASYGLGALVGRALTGLATGDEPDGTPRTLSTGWMIYGVASLAAGGIAAYHGYKRNGDSVGWAFGWYLFGAWLPFFAVPLALAEGYGTRARGMSGFGRRMKRSIKRTKRRGRK